MASQLVRFRLRNDTSSNWTTNNTILATGEPGYETNTNSLKIGDGNTTYNNLKYIKQDFVSIKEFGAIGNGSNLIKNTYNTLTNAQRRYPFLDATTYNNGELDWAAMTLALRNVSGVSIFFPSGTYQLGVNTLQIIGDNIQIQGVGNSSLITTGTNSSQRPIELRGVTNMTISNISFSNTAEFAAENYYGVIWSQDNILQNITFQKCYFTAPNCNTNAIKIITQSAGDSKLTSDITTLVSNVCFAECEFVNLGRMGVELQNHVAIEPGHVLVYYDFTQRYDRIIVDRCTFKNIGRFQHGMGVSFSGLGKHCYVGNCLFDNCNLAIEVVGPSDSTFAFNKFQNFPIGYDGTDSRGRAMRMTSDRVMYRNRLIGNRCTTPANGSTYIWMQRDLVMEGNEWDHTTSMSATFTAASNILGANLGTASTILTVADVSSGTVSVGMRLVGQGIPAYTYIVSSGDNSGRWNLNKSVTVPIGSTIVGVPTARFTAGNGSVASKTLTISGTVTGTIVPGMVLAGSGIALSTTPGSAVQVLSRSGTTLTLSSEVTVPNGSIIFGSPFVQFRGTISGATLTVTTAPSENAIFAGMTLYGSGVPANTTISSGSGSTWTLSNSATIGTAIDMVGIYEYPSNVFVEMRNVQGSRVTNDIYRTRGLSALIIRSKASSLEQDPNGLSGKSFDNQFTNCVFDNMYSYPSSNISTLQLTESDTKDNTFTNCFFKKDIYGSFIANTSSAQAPNLINCKSQQLVTTPVYNFTSTANLNNVLLLPTTNSNVGLTTKASLIQTTTSSTKLSTLRIGLSYSGVTVPLIIKFRVSSLSVLTASTGTTPAVIGGIGSMDTVLYTYQYGETATFSNLGGAIALPSNAGASFTATANGSATLSSVSSFTNIVVGMTLTGTGFSSNTIVTAYNTTSNTITTNNVVSAGTGITVTGTYTGVGVSIVSAIAPSNMTAIASIPFRNSVANTAYSIDIPVSYTGDDDITAGMRFSWNVEIDSATVPTSIIVV